MRLRAALPLLMLLLFGGVEADAQDPEFPDAIQDLLDGVLQLHIHARIIDEDASDAVWTMEVTRITISGRAVDIRLDGTNITVLAEFTPYWESEDSLTLLVQGQTWIYYDDRTEPEYRTSFTTLPIRLGEPIVFLPLGSGRIPLDTERFGRLNIELEVNVERYQS